uniref:Uncharacterized protein n=2 Tax=Oryza sativa subsp. japonica TaxID=39947 RepID=Q53PW0_ORYSJ|nr:hypothetical protein [Oryza sativa Japonica Group]ABA92638.1 hypothetical protein LOC_Os11g17730 [Oryza sativa Japonica Group]
MAMTVLSGIPFSRHAKVLKYLPTLRQVRSYLRNPCLIIASLIKKMIILEKEK